MRVPCAVYLTQLFFVLYTFTQGDACALGGAAVLGGPFSVIHGANLLCRLPDPDLFLSSARGLLAPGGLLVLVSPYSWLPQYTPKAKWIGQLASAFSRVRVRCCFNCKQQHLFEILILPYNQLCGIVRLFACRRYRRRYLRSSAVQLEGPTD